MNDQSISEGRLKALELASMMGTGRAFAPAYLAIAFGLSALIYQQVSARVSAIWALVYILYIVMRTVSTSTYHQNSERLSTQRVRFWRATVALSACSHAVILSSLSLLAFTHVDLLRQFALTAAVVLICAGSAVYAAAMFEGVVLFVAIALLPFAWAWSRVEAPMDVAMSSGVLIASILCLVLSWYQRNSLRSQWRLVLLNESMALSLAKQHEELEHFDHARTRLFSIASHDLRQPVHAFCLTVAQLDESDPAPLLKLHFDRLRQTSFLIAEMLQELMDLSNLERDRYPLSIAAVGDMQILLRQACQSHEALAAYKGLRLKLDAPSNVFVLSDANLLRRVLLNLISNAVKWTMVGSVDVLCFTDAGMCIIQIRDTGPGISRQQIADYYDDHVRLDFMRAAPHGIGMGLAVVRRALQLLGHELQITSTLGAGSVFELRVPLTPAPSTTAAHAYSPTALEQSEDAGKYLLVFEDDFHALHALKGLLQKWGFNVAGGRSVQQVLEDLPGGVIPSLVIADLELSFNDNGFDAIEAIRLHFSNPKLPAILLTGDDRQFTVSRASAGNISIAHKPFSAAQLREEIHKVMRSSDRPGSSDFDSAAPS